MLAVCVVMLVDVFVTFSDSALTNEQYGSEVMWVIFNKFVMIKNVLVNTGDISQLKRLLLVSRLRDVDERKA
jgi:hypothetical protein